MSFLYPRTIAIWRPKVAAPSAVGDVGYNAIRAAPWNSQDATEILTGLRASIQMDRQGQHNLVGLPTDAKYQAIWRVFIPKADAGPGSIVSTDIVVDDTGVAYQCFAPWWDSLGYQLRCIVLEV